VCHLGLYDIGPKSQTLIIFTYYADSHSLRSIVINGVLEHSLHLPRYHYAIFWLATTIAIGMKRCLSISFHISYRLAYIHTCSIC